MGPFSHSAKLSNACGGVIGDRRCITCIQYSAVNFPVMKVCQEHTNCRTCSAHSSLPGREFGQLSASLKCAGRRSDLTTPDAAGCHLASTLSPHATNCTSLFCSKLYPGTLLLCWVMCWLLLCPESPWSHDVQLSDKHTHTLGQFAMQTACKQVSKQVSKQFANSSLSQQD